ncbi:MAG: helix-turn-helix domain-containing protein [Nocardioidaceae bacterium]
MVARQGAPPRLEIRRNPALVAPIAALAALVALAYLWRVVDSGSAAAGLTAAGVGLVAIGFLALLVDSRSPLLVLDADGARIRLRRGWRTLTWESIDSATVTPRRHAFADGRLTVRTAEGQAYAVPLGLVTGIDAAAEAAMARTVERLASGRTDVVTVTVREGSSRPRAAGSVSAAVGSGISAVTSRLAQVGQAGSQRIASFGKPSPPAVSRPTVSGSTALAPEVVPRRVPLPEESFLRGKASLDPREDFDDFDETPPVVLLDSVSPAPLADPEPGEIASIGAVLREARQHVGITVDELAERTRIRPHIIEGIEADEFAACGGDVYARGHLRTLAFTLGVEPRALLARYDEHHAGAEISARRVFEAELAGGTTGSLRGSTGGSGWFLLAAVVLTLVLAWALMRIFVGGPNEIEQNPPVLPDDQASAALLGGVHGI